MTALCIYRLARKTPPLATVARFKNIYRVPMMPTQRTANLHLPPPLARQSALAALSRWLFSGGRRLSCFCNTAHRSFPVSPRP